ncbi:hypothetical protein NJH78_29105 [Pseudomonas chlororaphis]|uniref:DUF6708 domain-containing protein n=1 Tax=Pseudomonas chlororaphis TaxID=587753 RepID=UPI00209B3BF7|nr:DUF6708 domain-containing protein [Pseudomonas chlororaphis]MCO7574051.1 hypothetical protein [Pseudomonas chlororaphis]MCO7592471.1 hypothetical protein [Pseudomonas chlororaphis]
MTSSTPRSRQGFLSREDYLAPPAIPTGQSPKDVLNTIWRKNEVFLDIGSYSIGSFVMVLWPVILIFIWIMPSINFQEFDIAYWYGFMCFCGVPLLLLSYMLSRPVPPPVRFNRQRREVCVPFADGRYWIVPWEQVTAQAIAMSSAGQHGKTTQGLLVVGFHNPDPDAPEKERDFSLGFSCGGGETAMSLWECIRSYMEIGPEAVPKCNFEGESTGKGLLGWTISILWDALKSLLKGDFKAAFKDVFFSVFLGAPLGFYLQEKKLMPPPDLINPAIIEWSKPLPPEQWARRSAELEQAIDRQEQALQESATSS